MPEVLAEADAVRSAEVAALPVLDGETEAADVAAETLHIT